MSEACKHCYAETFSKRLGLKLWGPNTDRRVLSDSYWRQPLKWNAAAVKAGERHRVFCSSMADVFEDHPTVETQRARLWPLIEATPALDWLLLTKRPENMCKYAPDTWRDAWPTNVWAGTTVENQDRAEERVPLLLEVPAAVRFLSCEPLLGPVDLSRWMCPTHWSWSAKFKTPEEAIAAGAYAEKKPQALVSAHARFVDWCIVGGESGGGARPFDVAWARDIIRQCRDAGAAPFFKQAGVKPYDSNVNASDYDDLPGSIFRELPIGVDGGLAAGAGLRFADSHGGDMAEWPTDLRVRHFPAASHGRA